MPMQLDGDHLHHPVRLDSRVQDDISNAIATSSNHGEDGVIFHVKGFGRIPGNLQHCLA